MAEETQSNECSDPTQTLTIELPCCRVSSLDP